MALDTTLKNIPGNEYLSLNNLSLKHQVHLNNLKLKNSYKVEITNIDTNVVISCDSMRAAAKFLNSSHNTIKKYGKNQKILKKKYLIKISFTNDEQVQNSFKKILLTRNMTCRFFHSSNYTLNINNLAKFNRSDITLQSSIRWYSKQISKKRCTQRCIQSKDENKQLEVVGLSTLNCLVKFGSNLGSTLKYERFSLSFRNMSHIPAHLNSILVGVLLSEGYLHKNKTSKTLLALKQKNFEYLWFVFNKFSHYCRSLPIISYTVVNNKKYFIYCFATRVYPCFTE